MPHDVDQMANKELRSSVGAIRKSLASSKNKCSASQEQQRQSNNDGPTVANCPWKVGQRVEACDTSGNWYTAKIIAIEDFKMLIHFQRWSSRFDQWFDMDSALVRVKEDVKPAKTPVQFSLHEEVLAEWSNSCLYPAIIVKIFNDKLYCNVLFNDGYKKKIKMTHLKKLPANYSGDRIPPIPQTKEFSVIDPINHNEFVCETCKKGFRKQSLLAQHNKHYHNIDITNSEANVSSLNANSSNVLDPSDGVVSESATDFSSNVGATVEIDTPASIINEKVVKSEKRKCTMEISDEASINKKVKSENSNGVKASSYNVSPLVINNSSQIFETKVIVKKGKPNLVLPFIDANSVVEEHENDNIDETVKCVCPLKEENGLMVQCELCLTWQHGLCMGYNLESDVPNDGYFCPFCRVPEKAYSSQRNSYQLNHWLKNGQDPFFVPSLFTPKDPKRSTKTIMKNESESNEMSVPVDFCSSNTEQDPISKKFVVHDFTGHSNHGNNLDDHINNLIDINLKSDIFNKIVGDEEEAHISQVKAINMLSSAMYNITENLHSLDFKIYNHRDIAHHQIRDKQNKLKQLMNLVLEKLELIEKEIDLKDSYAIHTSASTLTAASPENFGISDVQCGTVNMNSTYSITGQKCSSSSIFANNFFDSTNPASPGSPMVGSDPVTANNSSVGNTFETSTLTSMQVSQIASTSSVDTANSHYYNIPQKLLTSSVTSVNDCQISETLTSTPSKSDQQTLARLFIANTPSVSFPDEQEIIQNQRPSMSHDYLPSNLTDGEIKHEILYHYKDLQLARELVLSLD